MGDVGAVAKLGHYLLALLGEPRLASWRARKLVEADKILAHGEAEVMEIRAVGAARAELAASAMLAKAGVPQSLLEMIEGEIDQRIDTLFEERLRNLVQIVTRAERALPPGQVPDVDPDLAWTSSFSEAAQDISDEGMQETWARVLAGEVARPGNTSVRTLSVLRELDQATALLFRRLCSMAITRTDHDGLVLDSFVLSPGGDPGMNALEKFGVSFLDLSVLNEYGLVFSSFKVGDDYGSSIAAQAPHGWEVKQSFFYQGQEWGLFPEGERDTNQKLSVVGVLLSKAGREIANAVELEHVPTGCVSSLV